MSATPLPGSNPRDARGLWIATIAERPCEACGTAFRPKPADVRQGYGRYCSLPCANRTKRHPKLKPRPLIDHPTDPSLALVPLANGKVAVIDQQDALIIGTLLWTAVYNHKAHKWYAISKTLLPNKKQIGMHQLILIAPRGMDVDHENGDGLDNRRSNLRIATRSQNNMNGGPPRDNTSGFRGVSWSKSSGRWEAYITKDRRRTHIGLFDSAEAAAVARDAKAQELFGDFARLNFPEVDHAASIH